MGAQGDGETSRGCYNGRRTAQANRLLAWISGTVLPAAGDPDVPLLGDFNANAQEDPVSTPASGPTLLEPGQKITCRRVMTLSWLSNAPGASV